MMAFMQSQSQGNPYLKEYQKTGEAFSQQMEQFYTQWQDLIKK
jgi:hypothetical protein